MCTGPHPFIPAEKTARLELLFEQEGQQIENVLHYTKGSVYSVTDLDDLVTDAITAWNTALAPVVAGNVTLLRAIATALDTETSGSVERTGGGAHGLSTGTPAPNGLSLRIRVTTALRGKSYRGGPYHIGLLLDDLEPTNKNDVTQASADAIRAAWANFVDDAGGPGTSTLAIVSYCHDNAWRTTAVVTPYLNISIADLHLDRQWRRMPPRGN